MPAPEWRVIRDMLGAGLQQDRSDVFHRGHSVVGKGDRRGTGAGGAQLPEDLAGSKREAGQLPLDRETVWVVRQRDWIPIAGPGRP